VARSKDNVVAGDRHAHGKLCCSHYSNPSHLEVRCSKRYVAMGLQFTAVADRTPYLPFRSV
jgi:hypothetical protein